MSIYGNTGTCWKDILDNNKIFRDMYDHLPVDRARAALRDRWRTLQKVKQAVGEKVAAKRRTDALASEHRRKKKGRTAAIDKDSMREFRFDSINEIGSFTSEKKGSGLEMPPVSPRRLTKASKDKSPIHAVRVTPAKLSEDASREWPGEDSCGNNQSNSLIEEETTMCRGESKNGHRNESNESNKHLLQDKWAELGRKRLLASSIRRKREIIFDYSDFNICCGRKRRS